LQKSLNDLKELLKPEGIAQLCVGCARSQRNELTLSSKFKTAPKNTTDPESQKQPKISLSPFAQMVYDNTAVEFTYPPTEKPIPSPLHVKGQSPKQKQKSPAQSKSKSQPSKRAASNNHSHNENSTITVQLPNTRPAEQFVTPPRHSPAQPNSKIEVIIPGLPSDFRRDKYTPTPSKLSVQGPAPILPQPRAQPESKQQTHQPLSHAQAEVQHSHQPSQPLDTTIPPSSNPSLAVVIPDLPSTFRPQDYEVLPDSPDTLQHLSRKRKHSEIDGDDDDLSRSVDQREKADTASRNLREYLQEIFEAENQLQQDNITSNYFFTNTGDGTSLSVTAQTKVESLLQKIISVGRFAQAPLEDLLRLQKMCEPAVKDAESIDMKVDDSMGESEVEAWLQQISTAELGIKAARTSLRLMAGGREDKQLYSEDVIQSALNVFKNVTETCIVPIVEMRSSGSSATLFKLLSAEKKVITNLLTQCRRLLSIMANLVPNIELSETVINTLEFTTSRLIFVENAHAERDSVLGIQKFDGLRVVAMDVLAQIFLCHPTQRQGIFDEILTSLEKLPVTKQSARQFKLADGGSIQLVSALIMRLIQTSASKSDDGKEKRRTKALEALNGDEDAEEVQNRQAVIGRCTITSETRGEQQPVTAIQELRDVASPLLDTAIRNATYVVSFIVNRAMKSTKTGDAPYRNLLDLFVEDFITCLNSTDWPAAELLLRLFLFKMVSLAEGEKTPAPAKNMALDLLGLMGAAISELNSHVRKTSTSLENGDSDLGGYLSRLAEASLERRASAIDLVSWPCGPFRACLEFLDARSSEDPQLSSAIGLFMAEWASSIWTNFDLSSDDDYDHDKTEKEYGRLAFRLRMMISDPRWLSREYSFDSVSVPHARLAYSLTLLHSQFCLAFGRVLAILLGSMTSEQATVRSKSLKSVNQVLDTDPTIIDREPAVKVLILRCANDLSVQVRDSALGLIGKCISLRPALEEEMIPHILQRVNDSGIGVRKRAMRLSKDIYLRNSNPEVRSSIADSLLHRVTDLDEGVQELARQTIEEVWMSPFYQSTTSDNTSAQFKLAMVDHVTLMVKTVQRGAGVSTVLDKILQNMLSNDSKFAAANFRVCKALVATMFETIIDNPAGEGNEAPSARDALQILMIFAKSNAKLFTAEQIQLLQPYIANVGVGDDLAIYRSVVVIFRHVLPHLSKIHNSFLGSVRKELLLGVGKMGRAILDDLAACVWIISTVLDDFLNVTRLVMSSLGGIAKMKGVDLKDPAKEEEVRKVTRLLMITGTFGKHCDLDPQSDSFRRVFPSWKDNSVSKLMADTFAPFASPSQPEEVRKAAFDAIGMVCQSWPKNFASANIYTSFLQVFDEMNSALEAIIMRSFKDFLLLEEKRSEAGSEGSVGAAADPQAKLGVMGGGHGDGIALGIAQRFLPHIIRIALSRQDEQGLLATEVVASIARQGLVHPKETGSSLIALETSQNSKIADIAFREHRALHEKHETILEKEYMRAVQLAYNYQRDVVQDTHGATLNPFASKLYMMMDVLKISKVKNRKKFYENLCARIEFDPSKMDMQDLPRHLDFSQFIIENMAFFDYVTVDELLAAITAMEKVVAATGTGIAHSIETEIFQISLDQPSQVDENGQQQPVERPVDPMRLTQLAASSMMLSTLWEARTYLRRQYGLMTNRRESKSKGPTKDLNKAPVRAQGVNGDKFWEEVSNTMAALDSEESMMNQCRTFVELLSVDHDFKVAAEGEDDDAEAGRLNTPSEDGERSTPGPPGSGRGRKRKNSTTPGGRKKRARSSSVPRGRGKPKGLGKRASVDKSDDEGGGWE
jgi:cohesin loading factor subunit SCC2